MQAKSEEELTSLNDDSSNKLIKFLKMKNSKKSFQVLVSKMEPLTETQEGKLKGGFSSAFQLSNLTTKGTNTCTNTCPVINIYKCPTS